MFMRFYQCLWDFINVHEILSMLMRFYKCLLYFLNFNEILSLLTRFSKCLWHLSMVIEFSKREFIPVLYNKTNSIPIVKYFAKFLSSPIVKYKKIADSRKIFNPKTPTLFFSQQFRNLSKTLISNKQSTTKNNQ